MAKPLSKLNQETLDFKFIALYNRQNFQWSIRQSFHWYRFVLTWIIGFV